MSEEAAMAPLSLTAAIKRLNQRLTMTDATLTLGGFAIAMDRILWLSWSCAIEHSANEEAYAMQPQDATS